MAANELSKERRKRLEEFVALLRVKPGSDVNLARDFDPAFKAGVGKKKDGVALLEEGIQVMSEYQARLAAQATWGVLVVLQALDAAGKDGTIRHVMSGVNPQGVSDHQHLLVVGAVEYPDLPALRQPLHIAPHEVVIQVFRRRLLERDNLAALRIHA